MNTSLPLLLAIVAAFVGCSPTPATVRCANNSTCEERSPEAPICADSICVECVSNVSCSDGAVCDGGKCTEQYE